MACRILVPWPGIELAPPSLEAQSPNHWTTRDISKLTLFFIWTSPCWKRFEHLSSSQEILLSLKHFFRNMASILEEQPPSAYTPMCVYMYITNHTIWILHTLLYVHRKPLKKITKIEIFQYFSPYSKGLFCTSHFRGCWPRMHCSPGSTENLSIAPCPC